jgi:hypothetical protein
MPIFKSTHNILIKCDEDEVFDRNWLDSDTIHLPPKREWDYSREMQIEDVDIWEVLYEASEGIGVYASWSPYAEFYMITKGIDYKNAPRFYEHTGKTPYWDRLVETFYGPGAQTNTFNRAKELNIPVPTFKTWVDDSEVWKYVPTTSPKTILLPR